MRTAPRNVAARRPSAAILAFRRQELERWIDNAITLLDDMDGDTDLEDDDREQEETDENGDEQDSSLSEDDNVYGGWFGSGAIEGGAGL